ncbi:unnamed protein product [Ectocarpus sp. CCAP 1310/34]|nr:unnamed protein product [Ectocarpus sp. CCAP 1310/34]
MCSPPADALRLPELPPLLHNFPASSRCTEYVIIHALVASAKRQGGDRAAGILGDRDH